MRSARGGVASQLSSLGSRGVGWTGIQFVLIWVVIGAGVRGRADIIGAELVVAMLAGCALIALGTAILFSGIRRLGVSLSALPKPVDDGVLIEDGVYAYVRHPIYLGVILVVVGYSVAMDALVALIVSVVLAVFLDLKARHEETLLRQRYPDYAAYASRTKRFIPYVY